MTPLDLPADLPLGVPVAVDTETSGLFIDGDWDKGPPARVSVVSLAYYETCAECGGTGSVKVLFDELPCDGCDGQGDHLRSWAFPFDQGRVAGKPGRFNKLTGTYDELPDPVVCNHNLGDREWGVLMAWLTGRRLVFHNAKFDLHILNAGLRDWPESACDFSDDTIWDTMLVQGILAPLQTSALKPTAARLWGEPATEQAEVRAALKKNGVGLTHRYDLLDWNVIGPYAAKDAELTIRLFHHHQQLIENGAVSLDQMTVINREFRLMELLFKMETRGIGFDAAGCEAEAVKIRYELARIAASLPFDPSKPAQAKKWFFGPRSEGNLGLVPQKVTEKTRQPQLDQAVLRELVKDGAQHAAELAEYSHLSSAIAKWYVGWPKRTGADGRLRTNFRQGRIESDRPGARDGGAISGRLSVERVQLQAIPHESKIPKGVVGVRSFFRAKPGHVLWELDLSQAEVRIATWAACCQPMQRVLAGAGSDVHGATATAVFGVQPGDDNWFELRQVAKRLTFGMLYGAGVRTIREQIRVFTGLDYSEHDTRMMIDTYRSTFPEFVRAARQAQVKADKGLGGPGFVRLAGGRLRHFGWGERTHKAFNAVIQGGQAEVAKEWMLAIEDHFPGVLLLMIHDSVVLEVPEDAAEYVVEECKKIGVAIFESYFSTEEIPIQFKIDAKQWGEAE